MRPGGCQDRGKGAGGDIETTDRLAQPRDQRSGRAQDDTPDQIGRRDRDLGSAGWIVAPDRRRHGVDPEEALEIGVPDGGFPETAAAGRPRTSPGLLRRLLQKVVDQLRVPEQPPGVQTLPFRDAVQFFRHWGLQDRVRGYAVFGGMPYYLSLIDARESLAENIDQLFLTSEAAPLREEPQHLLEADLQNVGRYASILHAVAGGANKRGEIINRIFGPSDASDSISPYFERLIALRLLTAESSIDVDPGRTRNVRYRVADPFLAFHYRFVTPNLTALETAPPREFYEALIAPYLDEYTSGPFEEMAREYVRRYGREVLPSAAREVGRIFASDFEVDVAGMLLDGSAVFGEAKWSVKHVGLNQVSELQSRIARVNYLKDAERKYLFLFSRSGFSPQVVQLAESDQLVRPISLKQMLSI